MCLSNCHVFIYTVTVKCSVNPDGDNAHMAKKQTLSKPEDLKTLKMNMKASFAIYWLCGLEENIASLSL